MVSVGPALPPHLAKRKRTPDDEEDSTGSPPAKVRPSEHSQSNKDEIDLDSDGDDGYGPSAPSAPVRPSIGPAPPSATVARPSLPEKNADTTTRDKRTNRSIGPSAPPPSSTDGSSRSIGPTLPPANTNEIDLDSEDDEAAVGPAPPPQPKRIQGPAPPPAALSERPATSADSEDDSDDDYGPALASSTSHQQRQARALAAAEAEAKAAANRAPKRDDWMLAPPSAGGARAADPTKLKARRFNSGPRASSGGGDGEISSIWTETPEEKRKRLEDAVLGRDTAGSGSGPNSSTSRTGNSGNARSKPQTAEEVEQAARIRDFTEATRGRSLYEEHQATRARGGGGDQQGGSATTKGGGKKKSWAEEEDDDPSKRAFDKEKDMKLGGRIGTAQRRELLTKAADFGGRFAKGKYL